jgi:hypothetical protein
VSFDVTTGLKQEVKSTRKITAAVGRWASDTIIGLVMVFLALLWIGDGSSLNAAAPTEYQLKAVFLMNFAKFVEWPTTAFRSAQSALTICVLGEDPFGRDLDDVVRGQVAGDRALAVKHLAQVQRGDNCHVLFVSGAEKARTERVLGILNNTPTLTVGEGDDFAAAGGMIALLIEDNKIRFEVNLDAAGNAGLKISSKLLKLARNVRERRKS